MITVTLRLFAAGNILGGQKVVDCTFDEGDRVETLMAKIALPANNAYVILVNGKHAVENTPLKDQDVVTIFPALAGG